MSKLIKWSLTAALAGFLFGFDTVVISGADQRLQDLWNSSDIFHGSVVMAMALWGTVFGAIFGGIPTRKFGRKTTLIWIGIFYSISAIGSAFANDPITFAIFRFLGGVGVRISISVYVLLVIRDCEFQGERLPVPDRNHALIWMRATVNVPVWFCLYASSRFGFV